MGPQRARRVLAVVKGLGPGGAEQLLVTAARADAAAGDELAVAYVLAHKDHLVPRLVAAGAGVHRLGGTAGMKDLRWALRLRRLLDGDRFDVVHLHSPVVAAVARLVARTVPRHRRPAVVSTEHNTWSSHHPLTRWANRLTYRLGDGWIAVSDEVLRSMPPALRPRTDTIVHGIDLADFTGADAAGRATTRAELGVGDHEVLALTVANLRRTKGYPHLLAAAAKVAASGVPVRFLAVGQGPMEAELRALADELQLDGTFTFLGFRTDTPRLLAAADVFVMASLHEGYPIAVMEAMASGLPIVATSVGGVPEAVESGTHGLLVDPGDPDALAAAVLELAADPERRRRMAATARASADRFDYAHAHAAIGALYDRVAPRR